MKLFFNNVNVNSVFWHFSIEMTWNISSLRTSCHFVWVCVCGGDLVYSSHVAAPAGEFTLCPAICLFMRVSFQDRDGHSLHWHTLTVHSCPCFCAHAYYCLLHSAVCDCTLPHNALQIVETLFKLLLIFLSLAHLAVCIMHLSVVCSVHP